MCATRGTRSSAGCCSWAGSPRARGGVLGGGSATTRVFAPRPSVPMGLPWRSRSSAIRGPAGAVESRSSPFAPDRMRSGSCAAPPPTNSGTCSRRRWGRSPPSRAATRRPWPKPRKCSKGALGHDRPQPVTSLSVAATAEEAATEAARRLAEAIREARVRREAAHVALAGGATPRRAYELLARDVRDWAGVEIWFGDERAVGPDHPDSNYRMVAATLLAGRPAPPPRVHRLQGERGAEEAAQAYEGALKERVPVEAGTPVLDVALQGVGPDGHTAS